MDGGEPIEPKKKERYGELVGSGFRTGSRLERRASRNVLRAWTPRGAVTGVVAHARRG